MAPGLRALIAEHSPASMPPPPAAPEASIRIAGATALSAMVTKSEAARRRISQARNDRISD